MCGDHRGEARRVLLLHGSIRADLSVLDLVALRIDGAISPSTSASLKTHPERHERAGHVDLVDIAHAGKRTEPTRHHHTPLKSK
jgi:hypothetical protein